jgi:hypothetical protein
LCRRLSGTEQTQTIKKILAVNRIQICKGFPIKTLCLKNEGTVKTKHKTVMVGDRTLSPKRMPIENGINE